MKYTKRDELTVIELGINVDCVSMEQIKEALMAYPTNMIYCESNGKLVGVISMGDVYRAKEKGLNSVNVNKKFWFLYEGEYIRAKRIFDERERISALPVITQNGYLIGDYTRWDDLLWMKNKLNTGENYAGCLKKYQKIAIVQPNNVFKEKQKIFDRIKADLQLKKITAVYIQHKDVAGYLESFDLILFIDENEIRACKTILLMNMSGKYGIIMKHLMTYRNLIESDINDIAVDEEQSILYLKKLYEKGIRVFGLIYDENKETPYYRQLSVEINNKFAAVGKTPSNILPETMYKDFFDDLYSEEFVNEIMRINLFCVEKHSGVLSLRDCNGKYYNVINGERRTTNQPEDAGKRIYLLGPCYILGRYSDDSHTIASLLQEYLCHDGIGIKVVNCGCFGLNFCNTMARIASLQLRKGDSVIIHGLPKSIGWAEYIDLNWVLEKNNVMAAWLVDSGLHCNHRVYKLYADTIYEALVPVITAKNDEESELITVDKNYVKFLYLDQYFSKFDYTKYQNIGAIVMNCNPFTYGHLYLIEQSLKYVDFLIVFVVEEDKSLFSFVERYAMVVEGTSNLKNIKVVPSGPFILTQTSFPEYFIKESSENIVEHTEQDIITFAEKIAPQLGIKYRFVGEELEDEVTSQYNLAMKKILPGYGIRLIEIPRKKVEGRCISASSVRKYIEQNNKEKLKQLLPESTRKLLFG